MRITERWLDETRGLRWVMWGAMIFTPCIVYLGVGLAFFEPGSWVWSGLKWSVYGATLGAVMGITGWLRLLLSRLLRIGRQD